MPRVDRRARSGGCAPRPAGHDGAFLVGPDGRRQLAAVLATAAARRRPPGARGQHGLALHRLLAGLDLAEVPAEGAEARDVDTWRDLRDLRDLGP